MRIRLTLALFAFSAAAQASSSLRVGNELLTIGDSAVRVTELLGKPSHKSHRSGSRSSSRRGRKRTRVITDSSRGEQWQYRRGDQVTIVTVVDGKVSDIEDDRR